ncbi:MAG: YggT family protein [Symploca sp. SIO1B1]|nr:YggT family protein [Symploca sp. SIO2D2]NER22426.1 YggT family protein [Symploca sp. SIO1C2]NER50346.1 YggT family protein [Symploca sp. SIO1A3]NER93075.1 YggT family protein [Symploca sp. SIO1B1]
MSYLLINTIATFFQIYSTLIIVRVLLTWLQMFGWANQVASFLSPITDPYLNLFRSFIPTFGGLDFSPVVAIIVLNIVSDSFTRAAFALT